MVGRKLFMVIGSSITLAILHFSAATAEGAPRNAAQPISTALSRIDNVDFGARADREDRSCDFARTFPVLPRTVASLHLNYMGGQETELTSPNVRLCRGHRACGAESKPIPDSIAGATSIASILGKHTL
jgi:hypothetical protein